MICDVDHGTVLGARESTASDVFALFTDNEARIYSIVSVDRVTGDVTPVISDRLFAGDGGPSHPGMYAYAVDPQSSHLHFMDFNSTDSSWTVYSHSLFTPDAMMAVDVAEGELVVYDIAMDNRYVLL